MTATEAVQSCEARKGWPTDEEKAVVIRDGTWEEVARLHVMTCCRDRELGFRARELTHTRHQKCK